MTNAITVNTPGGAIRAMAASLHVYRIMMRLNDLAPLELMETGLGGSVQRADVGASSSAKCMESCLTSHVQITFIETL